MYIIITNSNLVATYHKNVELWDKIPIFGVDSDVGCNGVVVCILIYDLTDLTDITDKFIYLFIVTSVTNTYRHCFFVF